MLTNSDPMRLRHHSIYSLHYNSYKNLWRKKIWLSNCQDGGQVTKKKNWFPIMSFISEKEPWLKSYFNQRGKTDINGKEKKAEVKTEPEGDKATGAVRTLPCKSTRNKVIWQTCCASVKKGQEGSQLPYSISLLQLRKYILGRIIRVGGNQMAEEHHKRGGEQKKLNKISWNTLALDPSCPLKWQHEHNRDNYTAANSGSSDPWLRI